MVRTNHILKAIIIDLGLITHVEDKNLGFKHVGTLGYMAPEVLKYNEGEKMYNYKSDIFSFGVLIYKVLYAQDLFSGSNKEEIYNNNKKVSFTLTDSSLFDLKFGIKKLIRKKFN